MLTETQVNNMIEVQDRLNCHLNPQWCSAGYDWSLAIMSECTELADQIGWKWWKHQPQAPLTQIHLEVVDIWHFVLSGLIEQGPCYVWIIDEDCARKWYRSLTILLKNTEQAHATAS